jgi:hypothetical protein
MFNEFQSKHTTSEAGRWAGCRVAQGRKGKKRRVWARGDLGMKEKGFHFSL